MVRSCFITNMKHFFCFPWKKALIIQRMWMLANYADLLHCILSDALKFSKSYTYIYWWNFLYSHLIWINDIIVPCCKCFGQRDISCKYDNSNHQRIWNHASHQQKRWSRWYSQPTLEKVTKKSNVSSLIQQSKHKLSNWKLLKLVFETIPRKIK